MMSLIIDHFARTRSQIPGGRKADGFILQQGEIPFVPKCEIGIPPQLERAIALLPVCGRYRRKELLSAVGVVALVALANAVRRAVENKPDLAMVRRGTEAEAAHT